MGGNRCLRPAGTSRPPGKGSPGCGPSKPAADAAGSGSPAAPRPAVVIAVVAGITLAVTGSSGAAGGAPPEFSLAPLSTLGALQPAPAPGPTGSEGVPVPAAAPLADTAATAAGQPVDQISCQASEQTLFTSTPTWPSSSTARHGRYLRGSASRARSPSKPRTARLSPPGTCFLLAAHPCRRRHHPHRVPGPADLYPRRLLR